MPIRRLGPVRWGDKRPPMLRFLQDGQLPPDENGVMVVVNYDQQWRTLGKAQRLGYIDDRQYLTQKGCAFLRAHKAETPPCRS